MPFSTCLFCKRSLDDFCYSIYDECNQPVLNILQLFEDVEIHLRNDRCICYECLYIIRWIYFMKKVLKEALVNDDIGENDRVIAAFNIFKIKMNQPIFLLDEENTEDENERNRDEEDENEVSHSNIEYVGSSSDSEVELRRPLDLTQRYDEVMSRKRKSRKKNLHESRSSTPPGTNPRKSYEYYMDSDWIGSGKCVDEEELGAANGSNDIVNGITQNEFLAGYSCTIKVCEHCCDTFEELRRHQEEDHLVALSGFTRENYEKQLVEHCEANQIDTAQRKKKFRCFLSDCRKVFKTVELLADHKMTEHNLIAKFWCPDCDNMPFTSQADRNQHAFIFHNTDMNCVYCSISFTTMQDYIRHLEEHGISKQLHGPNSVHKIYSCNHCYKHFPNMNLFNEHQHNMHSQQQPIINTESAPKISPTVIIKKCISNKGTISYNRNYDRNNGLCSFKVRLQKVSPVKKPETHLKWLSLKYPKQYLQKNENKNIKERETAKKVNEKVEISLPPRKRRLYHVAHQEEPIETCGHGNQQDVAEIDNTIDKSSEIKSKEQVIPIIEQVQQEIVKSIENIPNVIESDVMPIKTFEIKDKCQNLNETLEKSQKAMIIPLEIPKETTNLVEKVQNFSKLQDKLDHSADLVDKSQHDTNFSANITKIVPTSPKLIENLTISVDKIHETSISSGISQVVTTFEENEIEKPEECSTPTKTRLARKRKRKGCHKNFTHTKARKRTTENELEAATNQKTSVSIDVTTMQIAKTAEKVDIEPKLFSLDPVKPPVISNIEEKDNDSSPGRITMKISLKAIEQYKSSKEGKRESKRKKKLKGRKKNNKIILQTPTAITNKDNDLDVSSEVLQDNCVVLERSSQEELTPITLETNEDPVVQDLMQEQELQIVIEEHVECMPTLTEESENEFQINENNIILNKDEINMIILGETPGYTNAIEESLHDNNSHVENNHLLHNKTNNSDVDCASDMDIIDDNLNTKITIYDGHNFAIPMGAEPQVKKVPSTRPSIARKLKQKADSISNKQRKVKANQKLQTMEYDTVESQIANVLLKDHVYAKSAFIALKHSK